MNAEEALMEVARQVETCRKCVLCSSRKKSVPGEGPANTEILFIGEGPGFHENEQGRPFVGQAGKYLDELLQGAGLKRSQVFITNVVKCRPPGNRDPLPDELAACSAYLDAQQEALNPPVIVTLGRYSMARYLPNAKISSAHGQPVWIKGRLIVPMYHPAAALHQPALKPLLDKDFSHLGEWLEQARKTQDGAISAQPDASTENLQHNTPPPAEPSPPEQPTQLSLF